MQAIGDSGATEQDIAACLGHSITTLVGRYAHLSPAHLQGVVEKFSAFGRPVDSGGSEGQVSVATVTQPENGREYAVGSGHKPLKKLDGERI